jgi:hypothetical protein
MTPAQGIEKLGFRRWYERQLIEGHVYFVTCFLSMIVIAASLEQIDWRASPGQIMFLLAVLVAGGALCIASLRRYNFLLVRAECLGSQSNCPECRVYGVLKVIGAGEGEERRGGVFTRADNPWIRVRCKKCGHEWRMENS